MWFSKKKKIMIKLSVKGSLKQNKNILKKFIHRKISFLKEYWKHQ